MLHDLRSASTVRVQVYAGRPDDIEDAVLSAFSNPVEGGWWRHEEHGIDPFPGQQALYEQTRADCNGHEGCDADTIGQRLALPGLCSI